MGWIFGQQGEPTLPAVQARPPDPNFSGVFADSPFVQDTLSQFLHGPVNTIYGDKRPGVGGAVGISDPRTVVLNALYSQSLTQPQQESTLAHETFHTGSMTNSLNNIPDEVQEQVLEAFWKSDPELRQAAESRLLNPKSGFLDSPTTAAGSMKKKIPTQRLVEKEEAVAYAFQGGMELLRMGNQISREAVEEQEKYRPGSAIMYNHLKKIMGGKDN